MSPTQINAQSTYTTRQDQVLRQLKLALDQHDTSKALTHLKTLSDVDYADFGGLRALHYAAQAGDVTLLKALIKRGANVNVRSILGSTPLMRALEASEVSEEVLLTLIKAGASGELPSCYAHLLSTSPQGLQVSTQASSQGSPSPSHNSASTQTQQRNTKRAPHVTPQVTTTERLMRGEPLQGWLQRQAPLRRALEAHLKREEAVTPLTLDGPDLLTLLERLEREADQDPLMHLTRALTLLRVDLIAWPDAERSLRAYERALELDVGLFHPAWLVMRALEHSSLTPGSSSPALTDALICVYQELQDPTDLTLLLSALNALKKTKKATSQVNTLAERWGQLKPQLTQTWRRKLKEPMESLFKLVGLESVKRLTLEVIAAAHTQTSLPSQSRVPQSLHYALLGNPGTGKTTVARLLGRVLHAIELRSAETFEEVTARQLMSDGLDALHLLLDRCEGGVLFIDEAYALNPEQSDRGREILEELLVAAEVRRERLSIFLAGYQRDMEQRLFAYNEGLQSRFVSVTLEDFSTPELNAIWRAELARREGWREEGKEVGQVLARRLGRRSGARGFGNARDVRSAFEHAARASLARDQAQGNKPSLMIKLTDVIGEPPSELTNPRLAEVLRELDQLTGQVKVKEGLRELIAVAEGNYNRELRGERPLLSSLHRLFLGNPGTGKTTVAKLYGRLLRALNLLSDGEVLLKSASDLVGSHVGESQRKTRALLELARGKVLLIDEAYSLNDSLYGKQALDTLVEQVSASSGEDLAVVMCGYTREMEAMLRDQNPGLSRRFPRDQALMFEDFSDVELMWIAKRAASRDGLELPLPLAQRLARDLGRKRAIPHFGNAGEVEQRLNQAKRRLQARLRDEGGEAPNLLRERDLFEEPQGDSPLEALKAFGVEGEALEHLKRFEATMRVWARDGGSKPLIGHLQFLGNPGTGKTSVARLMGRFFYELGVLARPDVVETSGLDITGGFVGQTKDVVRERLNSAAGGVLFIDEAYELAQGPYGSEAITSLVQLMTEPSYHNDKTIIIFAGYEAQMSALMRQNPGLAGRCKGVIRFSDWGGDRCAQLFKRRAQEEGLTLALGMEERVGEVCERLAQQPYWANARDVLSLFDETRATRSLRVLEEREPTPTLTRSDLVGAFERLSASRASLKPLEPVSQLTSRVTHEPLFATQPRAEAPVVQERLQEEERSQELQEEEHSQALQEENHLQEAQRSLAALFKFKGAKTLTRAVAGEESLEAALERRLDADPDLINSMPTRGLSDPNIQAALQEVIKAQVERGMSPEEAQRLVESEAEELLTAQREARKIKEGLNERLSHLKPVYVCQACRRPWGVCTFLGPVIDRWESVELLCQI